MTKRKASFIMAIVAVLFLTTHHFAFAESEEFEDAFIYLEQNATDGDTEVVILAKGGDEGFKTLKIADPDGKKIIQLNAKKRTLGTREFAMESPEPDLDSVLKAYPEGEYTFKGKTISGEKYMSTAYLSHVIPDPAENIYPADEQEINPDEDLEITWDPVPGAVKYLVEVEREDPEPEKTLQGDVEPSDFPSFTVSADWLEPDAEYQVGVAVVNADGNITWVEQAFTTAK